MSKIINGALCSCGKIHKTGVRRVVVGAGVVSAVVDEVKAAGASRVFLLFDHNTYAVAGERVEKILADAGVKLSSFTFGSGELEPDERSVGAALMHFDPEADIIIAVGSGVINDIAKVIATAASKPYFVVATAPSMDGYASASSSMVMDGLKVSLKTKCPEVIIGDTDVLKTAPDKMLISGLGDMIAKYVSICEWRISAFLTGEYFCEAIAEDVRASLKRCIDNKDGLLARDSAAVEAVFEGLVSCGRDMEYAGLSRPASGVEHYFSHVWDMRGLEFGTPVETHGIQCAVGTAEAVKLYERIKKLTPDKDRAMAYVDSFDFGAWSERLRALLGQGAEVMIAAESKDGKYDKVKHGERLERIIDGWDHILSIIDSELPEYGELCEILRSVGLPTTPREMGFGEENLKEVFEATKDIRDKYVLSRLAWDLGITDLLFA